MTESLNPRYRERLIQLTPDGFKAEMEYLQADLIPIFIDEAKQLSESGEAQIILPLKEFHTRAEIMASCIQPGIRPHNIDLLMSELQSIRAEHEPTSMANNFTSVDMPTFWHYIVHSLDGLRNVMVTRRLITHKGERLLKREDRTSDYYNQPEPEAVELEWEGHNA